MKILVTGSKGFIGRNLISVLKELDNNDIIEIDRENSVEELNKALDEAEFIFHLAGINRPKNEEEFFEGNSGLTKNIVDYLKSNNKNTPIVITSSIQADLDNAYGRSKKMAENYLKEYSLELSAKVTIYRLPNVFGKWCKPNYNSAIATFCHNIARDIEIWINDRNIELNLVYIDDVIRCLLNETKKLEEKFSFKEVDIIYKKTLGYIVDKLKEFKEIRKTSILPNFSDNFLKVLYSTYLSYLPENEFSYHLDKKIDNRGWLAEIVKSNEFGQIFVSKTKAGITRGNHYHHTKVEKFIVIQGKAEVKFRNINNDNVISYIVEGEDLEVIDIPVGYTHSITNIGKNEVITLFWANEIFNQEKPDTFWREV
ncbi:NAD-dependent epimerase/dehydratase family protein [Clostridium tertium]|uniref:polysaccharide biosynthesis C-terminal domain-containing protein n=1 Tax=Clostridium tertium TaxID=1559 RepID=UPI00232B2B8E|nr:NAD-dependent epimerase/dehydratase family protein [Clostridium tertium]MDB1921733.1 NAD-dependent epimerase/dehydratase family protein [Clostridium tertium]MDB1924936.1 NAD-dependent epimerase/dehydratase family protein [Clostridium tertium]MDB1929575.1 NAD-dependent epimerase/dehydratase family protein [Clostridium tertium]